MLRLLQLIFLGHVHSWKIHEESSLVDSRKKYPIGTSYVLRCSECGNMKHKQFRE